MKKVGALLNEHRERQRHSLEDVAQATKIRLEYLRAIESNDFSLLPAAVFVKGFLSKYARFLRIDEAMVLAVFRRDFTVAEKGKIIPREFISPLARRHGWLTPKLTTRLSIAIVFISIIGYATLQWYRLRLPPKLEVFSPNNQEKITEKTIVTGQAQLDAIVTVNDEPVSMNAEGVFRFDMEFPSAGTYTIVIRAEDRSQRSSTIERVVEVLPQP